MNKTQWVLYLSGVAADCMSDRAEGQRLIRSERVDPCQQCTVGFQADADARGACVPAWFKGKS
jgi:hypothetical protein